MKKEKDDKIFTITHFELLQLSPAPSGWVAILECDDGAPYAAPVLSWGLAKQELEVRRSKDPPAMGSVRVETVTQGVVPVGIILIDGAPSVAEDDEAFRGYMAPWDNMEKFLRECGSIRMREFASNEKKDDL